MLEQFLDVIRQPAERSLDLVRARQHPLCRYQLLDLEQGQERLD